MGHGLGQHMLFRWQIEPAWHHGPTHLHHLDLHSCKPASPEATIDFHMFVLEQLLLSRRSALTSATAISCRPPLHASSPCPLPPQQQLNTSHHPMATAADIGDSPSRCHVSSIRAAALHPSCPTTECPGFLHTPVIV